MFGDYNKYDIRAAAILTTAYVAGTVIEANQQNQLVIYLDFTKGSLTTAELKVEFSPDNSDYYQETASSVTAGVDTNTLVEHQVSATAGKYRIAIPIKDRYIKISVKGTGTPTSSSAKVTAILGSV